MSVESAKRTTALKYGESSYEDLTYQFFNVNPDNGTNSVTINSSQGQEIVHTIPALSVFNPSKSFLEFTSTPEATASSYNYQHVNTIPFFQRIDVKTVSGQPFQYNDNLANKLAVELPIKTTKDELRGNDEVSGGAGIWEGLSSTNGTITSTQPNQFGKHPDAVATNKNYTEKKDLVVGGLNTATPIVKWRIPLRLFGDFLACDRAVCFAEPVQITLLTSPITKCYFLATSAIDPTSGTGAGTSVALSAIKMDIAYVEDDFGQATKIRNKMLASGLSLLVENTVTTSVSLSGTTQNYTYNLSSAQGKRIRYMKFAAFQTQTTNKAYFRNNQSQAIYTALRTYMGGKYRQQSPMTISNFDDYLHMKNIIKTSCYQSTGEFYHDPVFIDAWCDHNVKDPTKSLGFPLQGNGNDTYMIEATTVSATNVFNFFATYERRLAITREGILTA